MHTRTGKHTTQETTSTYLVKHTLSEDGRLLRLIAKQPAYYLPTYCQPMCLPTILRYACLPAYLPAYCLPTTCSLPAYLLPTYLHAP